MINIPLSFFAMWLIMLLGVLTNIMYRINKINHDTPGEIKWKDVVYKFFNKEWASYGMSLIFTGIVAYSFIYMKQFENPDNEEISRWAKWIPLAVIILYGFGVLNQVVFYWALGKIQKKGQVDIDILKKE